MVDDRQLQFKELLRTNDFSVTKARLLVFDLLLGKEPQTMHELYDLVDGRIDRASLYRVIDLFERLGVVERLQSGWKYKLELSDSFSLHHHHITCVTCGKVLPITEEEDIESLISKLADRYGVQAVRHQLEIQGVCQDCRLKHTP